MGYKIGNPFPKQGAELPEYEKWNPGMGAYWANPCGLIRLENGEFAQYDILGDTGKTTDPAPTIIKSIAINMLGLSEKK